MNRIRSRRAVALLLAALLVLSGCRAQVPSTGPALLLDGEPWEGGALAPESEDSLRVYITLDGAPLADLPFSEAHTVCIAQPDGSENIVELTGAAVVMRSANCENQDCVKMGEVTRENLEVRVMGGFIICLPHRISVEVRGE